MLRPLPHRGRQIGQPVRTPLLPSTYDLAWSVMAITGVVLAVVALVRWLRQSRSDLTGLVQLAVIIRLPWLGPAAYLLATRTPAAAAPTADTSKVGG